MMGAIGSIGVFRIAKGWANKDYGEIAWTFFPGPEMMWKGLTMPYDVGKSLYEGNYTAAVFRYTDHVLTGLSFAVGLPGEGTAVTQTIKEGVIVEAEVTSGILAGEIEASAATVVEKEVAETSTQLSTRFISTSKELTDLQSTLNRIASGGKFPHRNDGAIFKNVEGLLPKQNAGFYREFVHPTPGVTGPGPMRIVTGQNGSMWFTPDHYKTFIQIR